MIKSLVNYNSIKSNRSRNCNKTQWKIDHRLLLISIYTEGNNIYEC